jgi:predicted nucleotidyltransferase
MWSVLRVFFDDPDPREGFTVRWISRQIDLSPPSVKLHLDELSKPGSDGSALVTKMGGRIYPAYWPNRRNSTFRFFKKMDMLFRLEECGLLDFLESKCSPDAIVLFGSAAKGEDVMGSDIDLFVHSPEKSLELKRYESALKRKISLHFSPDLGKLPKELKNNVINGIILKGYLKVF